MLTCRVIQPRCRSTRDYKRNISLEEREKKLRTRDKGEKSREILCETKMETVLHVEQIDMMRP